MKKKLLLVAFMVAILTCVFAISASAATYSLDKDGVIQDGENENTKYQFTIADNAESLMYIYVYDIDETKIIVPDMPNYTRQMRPGTWQTAMAIYHIDDTERTTNLMAQITEVELHESVYLDGAYSTGAFSGYTSLQKISFYNKVGAASKGGFFQNCVSLDEIHFYGKDLAIPSVLFGSDLGETGCAYNREFKVVFHEGATGTLATGGDTLPTYAKLGGWKIIINENITPSNPADPRLGAKWGSITATNGWELILAVDNLNSYTQDELEALKTSHGFCSRFADVASATVKEATVTTYCALGYDEHDNKTSVTYANGYMENGQKLDGCSKCNTGTKEVLAPIFKCVGYSVSESGSLGIALGYTVDTAALEKYEGLTDITLKYGLFVAVKDVIGTNDLFDSEGNTANGAVAAEISSSNFISFEIKVVGLENYQTTEFALGAYVIDGANEQEKISYLQFGAPAESQKYYFASYNQLTALFEEK